MGIAEARTELATLIGAIDHLPERIDPPVITISADDPYLEPGDTYCNYIVYLEATVIVRGTNQKATTDLDNAIDQALANAGGWGFINVSQPVQLEYGNALYLGAKIHFAKAI